MILSSFLAALGQLGDPRFLKVLGLGLALTVALLFGVYAGLLSLIDWLMPETLVLPFVGEVRWIDDLLSGGSILLMLVLSAILMVPVASAFTGLFLDEVAAAVEARHYPHLPPAPRIPLGDMLIDTLNFVGVLIAVNIVALVFYLAAGPLAPVVFWAVNGYLLGREYFQMAAMRRIGRQRAGAMRVRHRGRIALAGLLMAGPLSVPVVNLLVPVLGAATFTHIFHRLAADDARGAAAGPLPRG